MTDESTSARALIDAYKSCARPLAAAEAQLWATLAAAERAEQRRDRRPTPSLAPWLALAAGLLLLAAWQLDLAGMFASGHVLRDIRDQAAYDAAEPEPLQTRTRGEPAGGVGWRETARPESGPAPAAPTGRQRPAGAARGAPRASKVVADAPGLAADSDAAPDDDRVLAEMALLQEAQAALRGGQPAAALRSLDRHAQEFAAGSMTEERQALRVLALCAAGEVARGADEAAVFLGAHPRSTYAARVAAACLSGHASKDMYEAQ